MRTFAIFIALLGSVNASAQVAAPSPLTTEQRAKLAAIEKTYRAKLKGIEERLARLNRDLAASEASLEILRETKLEFSDGKQGNVIKAGEGNIRTSDADRARIAAAHVDKIAKESARIAELESQKRALATELSDLDKAYIAAKIRAGWVPPPSESPGTTVPAVRSQEIR